jgi:hypothetical protein
MTETKPKRRFRFGIRTLLVVVTLAAVGSWAYWFGWPWWMLHQRQASFLDAAMQFKVGATDDDLTLFGIPDVGNEDCAGGEIATDEVGQFYRLERWEWPNVYYYIVGRFGPPRQQTANRIEIYRVSPIPANYLPRTELGRQSLESRMETLRMDNVRAKYKHSLQVDEEIAAHKRGLDSERRTQYARDFLDVLTGKLPKSDELNYELIYSDPPARPMH